MPQVVKSTNIQGCTILGPVSYPPSSISHRPIPLCLSSKFLRGVIVVVLASDRDFGCCGFKQRIMVSGVRMRVRASDHTETLNSKRRAANHTTSILNSSQSSLPHYLTLWTASGGLWGGCWLAACKVCFAVRARGRLR